MAINLKLNFYCLTTEIQNKQFFFVQQQQQHTAAAVADENKIKKRGRKSQ